MNKLAIFLAFFIVSSLYSQSILMTINKDTIYTKDIEKEYSESLEVLGTQNTIDNFIDFNLIKQYGVSQNLEKSITYLKELSKKSQEIQDSLYYPEEFMNPLLQDYYNKIKTERKVQIIVFNNNLINGDNEKEKKSFINKIIKQINNNPSKFEQEANQYSLDPKLGIPFYLDVFSVNKDLLDIIYEAPIGKVVSNTGENNENYLILVSDERKWLGHVSLDEIFVKDNTKEGKLKIESIYKQLREGKDFNELKKKYSDKSNGQYIYKHIDDEDTYKYVLNQINKSVLEREVSSPIETKEGYVIYKYIYTDDYNNYNQAKSKIYAELKQPKLVDALDERLIKTLNEKSFNNVNSSAIDNFIKELPNDYKDLVNFKEKRVIDLINIGNKEDARYILTNKDLLDQIKYQATSNNYVDKTKIINELIDSWQNQKLIEYYKENFFNIEGIKERMKQEQDILISKYTFSMISNQAYQDIEGQKKFLKENKNRFTWQERIDGAFYFCLNEEVEQEVLQLLQNKKSENFIKDYFKTKTDKEKNQLVIIEQGKFPRKFLGISSQEKLSKGIHVFDSKNRRLIIDIKNIVKNEPMSLEELRKYYINEYVDYKIQEIMKQMKENAVININPIEENKLKQKYN